MTKILKELPALASPTMTFNQRKELKRAVIVSMSHGLKYSQGNLSYLMLLETLMEITHNINVKSEEMDIWFYMISDLLN